MIKLYMEENDLKSDDSSWENENFQVINITEVNLFAFFVHKALHWALPIIIIEMLLYNISIIIIGSAQWRALCTKNANKLTSVIFITWKFSFSQEESSDFRSFSSIYNFIIGPACANFVKFQYCSSTILEFYKICTIFEFTHIDMAQHVKWFWTLLFH